MHVRYKINMTPITDRQIILLYKLATNFDLKLSVFKTHRVITDTNLILKNVFDTIILIYVIRIRTYYFQNNHKHTPLIMLHMTTRILTAILKYVSNLLQNT
jgi:hypothetical protein